MKRVVSFFSLLIIVLLLLPMYDFAQAATLPPITAKEVTPTFGSIGDCHTNNTCPTGSPTPSGGTNFPSSNPSTTSNPNPSSSVTPPCITAQTTTHVQSKHKLHGKGAIGKFMEMLLNLLKKLLEWLLQLLGGHGGGNGGGNPTPTIGVPSTSPVPSNAPSSNPSAVPSTQPSAAPSAVPSQNPCNPTPTTGNPSPTPSSAPTLPATTPSPITSNCTGPTVTLTGITTAFYRNTVPANGTTFNLHGWFSNAVTGVGSDKAFEVGMSGSGTKDVCVLGGVVDGHIDPSLSWRVVHDSVSGFGYGTGTSGIAQLNGIRVHNVEDGWHPRECVNGNCTAMSNLGTMLMQNTYMSAIRDDSIEDDSFMPGTISDSLFDGTFTFLSEQNQAGGTNSIGPNEDHVIHLNKVFVRLTRTNAAGLNTIGYWFKWQPRGVQSHTVDITDSVFAIDVVPIDESGAIKWSKLDFPPGTVFHGTNYILWMGPGAYAGPKPAGVTYLEGQAAKDKWAQVRNNWLTTHGYAPLSTTDFNPYDNPVVAPK